MPRLEDVDFAQEVAWDESSNKTSVVRKTKIELPMSSTNAVPQPPLVSHRANHTLPASWICSRRKANLIPA